MIDRSARKIGELGAGSGDAGLPFLIGIADDGIGVRNVQIVADQRDAERRIEVVQEDGSQFGSAIAIGAQQRDAVSALGCGTGEPRYRGCSKPVANAWTCNPCGTVGVSFPHATTFAICIGGIKYCCSAGSGGLAPISFLGSPPS
jgi:hypothetical protein